MQETSRDKKGGMREESASVVQRSLFETFESVESSDSKPASALPSLRSLHALGAAQNLLCHATSEVLAGSPASENSLKDSTAGHCAEETRESSAKMTEAYPVDPSPIREEGDLMAQGRAAPDEVTPAESPKSSGSVLTLPLDLERSRYEHLRKQVEYHNHKYFVEHAPTIDDTAYDALIEQLKALEARYPQWVDAESPTQRIGERVSGEASLEHFQPMISLDKVFDQEGVRRFFDRMESTVGSTLFYLELKMDGCAVAVHYRKGVLVAALTRGDGKTGDDITDKVATLLPRFIERWKDREFVELRGEIYMEESQFQAFNAACRSEGRKSFANPRNATAGTLRLLDIDEFRRRNLKIALYAMSYDSSGEVASLTESWRELSEAQVPTVSWYRAARSVEEMEVAIKEVQQMRSCLNFGIDGVVIKIDRYSDQQELGSTGQYYRWALAYKFTPVKAVTRVLDIEVQVGRTGIMTPVAHMEPIFIDGSLVSRCSLYNFDEIQRLDLRIGDYVEVMKGGDIIPKIIKVLPAPSSEVDERMYAKSGSEELRAGVWLPPDYCPSCGGAIRRLDGEVAARCSNGKNCPQQVLRRLIYFCSKDAFDIEGLGEKTLEQLYTLGIITSLEDIFTLRAEQLCGLDGFGDKSIDNLLESITSRRSISFERFIYALGLPGVGASLSKLLARAFDSLAMIASATEEELLALEGIGPLIAKGLIDFFTSDMASEYLQLEKSELLTIIYPSHERLSQRLEGAVFVITGSFTRYSRSELEAMIRGHGGKVTTSISKKTSYLAVGKEPGSKLAKAERLGVEIIYEEQLFNMLGIKVD